MEFPSSFRHSLAQEGGMFPSSFGHIYANREGWNRTVPQGVQTSTLLDAIASLMPRQQNIMQQSAGRRNAIRIAGGGPDFLGLPLGSE